MKRFLRKRRAQRGTTLTGYALLTAGLVTVSLGAIEAVNQSAETVLGETAKSVGTPPPVLGDVKIDRISASADATPTAEATPAVENTTGPETTPTAETTPASATENTAGLPGIIDDLTDASDTATSKAAKKLDKAIEEANKALDELAETTPDVEKAIKKLAKAAKQIDKAVEKGFPVDDAEALNAALADSALELAQAEITAAIARGGDQDDIDDALEHLADGFTERAERNWEKAIKEFADAAKNAQDA